VEARFSGVKMTIAIIGAMSEEIEVLRTHLNLKEHHSTLKNADFYMGTIHNENVLLVRSGIGKVNAASATTVIAERYHPRCIINVGVLGALRNDLEPGSLIFPHYFTYHDVDVTSWGYAHGQIPSMPENYKPSPELQSLFERLATNLGIKFYSGPVLTGDRFVDKADEIALMKSRVPDAIGVEMESAAIAQVAYLYQIPMGCIRAISDFANEESKQVFADNLVKASENVAKLILESISTIVTSLT
jgi:adenosylhomocysteine nucleosidase